jgi:predicted Zn-dependent protease
VQNEAIETNRCLLNIYANKADEATAAIEALKAKTPESEMPALLLASMHHRQKKYDKCEEVLRTYKSSEAQLTLAQMYLKQGKISEAGSMLGSIKDLKHAPATVATLVALYQSVGDDKSSVKTFDEAIKWRSSQGGDDEFTEETLLIQVQTINSAVC